MQSSARQKATIVAYVCCAVVSVACSGNAPPSSGEPGSGSASAPRPGNPATAVTTNSGPLDLARRLGQPDAELNRLLSSDDHAFRSEDDSFVSPSWDDTGIDRFREVAARLPARSVDSFTVGLGRIARFALKLNLEGIADVPGSIHAGRVVYPEAFHSTDVIWATVDDRAEELLVLRRPDAPHEFAWRVAMPRGLESVRRERSGALVFADRRGDAVLRVPVPYAIDARGTRRDAALAWNDGRLTVRLDTATLEYPVLLDPAVEIVLWEEKTPKTTVPGGRAQGAMVYDSSRGQSVLIAGADASGGLKETWGWDGSDWSLIDSTTTPPYTYISAAYDSAANVSIMLGACDVETWKLSGSTWSKPSPVDAPAKRNVTAMAYDGPPPGGRGKTVLFGGGLCDLGQNANDTWEWDGTNWTPLSPSTAPDERAGHAMVYDAKNHVTVLFGGMGAGVCCGGANDCWRADTWTWDGTTWEKKTPAKSPPGRYLHQMAYDTASGRTVMFGGNNCPFLGDTWEWDGSTWKETTPATSPAIRVSSVMDYDSARGRVVLFGGADGTYRSDTWEYHSHGEACANDTECDTGHCVDGVCCEQATCGQCEACDTVATPGVCAAVKNTQDDSCNGTMACDGTSACMVFVGKTCPSGCPKGLFCVDGVCCSTACTGQCEACDVTASMGTCVTITGKPHVLSHTACNGQGTTCGGICAGNAAACTYPDATKSCRTAGCANSTVTAAAGCDGTGACPAAQTSSCLTYACAALGGAACETGCTTDPQCSSTAYCMAPSCVAKLPPGADCTEDRACQSDHCVDGVCCDTACQGQCEACVVGGIKGVCQAVNGDPVGLLRAPCAGKGTTCGGTCDGTTQATCTYPDTTVKCRTASCTANVGTFAATCDGAGSCPLVTQDCSPLACSTTSQACQTNCDASTPCQGAYYCDLGICKKQHPIPDTCASDVECLSGHCADGVCCDKACQGQCEACDLVAGSCIPVTGAPRGTTRPACGGGGTPCVGVCDGTGRMACAYPGTTTECRAASCAPNVAVLRTGCDGTGACPAVQTQACAPYVCGATQCLGDCPNGDSDCQTGKFCSGGICKDKLPIADPCGASTQCASGHCADNVCCDVSCQGQCQACNETGSEGTCKLVTGVPRGARSACAGSGPCMAVCDGKSATSCNYPDGTAVCAPETCKDDIDTKASVCNGSGACTTAATASCAGYLCASNKCSTTCTGAGDCATGYWCSSGKCLPLNPTDAGLGGATGSAGAGSGAGGATGAAGGGGTGARGGTGATSGASGSSSPDAGVSTGGAGAFTDVAKQDSGCGCRTARRADNRTGSLLVALGLAASLARRRRKQRSLRE